MSKSPLTIFRGDVDKAAVPVEVSPDPDGGASAVGPQDGGGSVQEGGHHAAGHQAAAEDAADPARPLPDEGRAQPEALLQLESRAEPLSLHQGKGDGGVEAVQAGAALGLH